jgi:tetratricopeptide (TPR) repeat protein
MRNAYALVLSMSLVLPFASAQTAVNDGNFKIALPNRSGQLGWHADGFKVVQSSAKPNGNEIGLRGANDSGRLGFLGFLFVFPEQAPMTSAKCRDGIVDPVRKANPKLKLISNSRITRGDDPPIEVVNYSLPNGEKSEYSVRAFIATGELCADFEIYSETVISPEDREIRQIVESLRYDPKYTPQFGDSFVYAQILYQQQQYSAAAPIFESALAKLNNEKDPSQQTMRRVVTDQAGIAYGASGNIKKARSIFEAAIKTDPDYPLYYYNLACADAEEKKLSDARVHLEQAFARKKNVLPGESIPDPTKDDSFLPYQDNKEFWAFLKTLR